MKIGIFTECYHPTVNGVVVSVDTFRGELEKHGHQYYIFTAASSKPTKDPKNVFRLPSFHFPQDKVYPLAWPLPTTLIEDRLPIDIIKQLDIIHVQHFSAVGQHGLNLAKKYDIPSVYTYHTMAELYTSYLPVIGSLSRPILRSWTRHTAGRAAHLICPTPSVKQYLRSIGVQRHVSVIPTGIKRSLYKPVNPEYAKAKYNIPKEQDLTLFVGRLSAEKNVDFLLEAFAMSLEKRPDTHLILVGDGPDREKYQRWVAQRQLNRNISFTGFLDRKETIKLFGSVKLFLFPSVTDTQGIVISEAMAGGAVPVAVDMLGPHDLIEHGKTGMLVDLNKTLFSDTITNLLADNQKREKLSKNAQLAANQLDTAVTAAKMEELYLKLIDRQ